MKKIKVLFMALIIFVGAFVFTNLSNNTKAVSSDINAEDVEINIPESSTGKEITNILYKNDLIRSKLAFKKLIKKDDISNQFKPGDYIINKSMDMEAIIEQLVKGPKRFNDSNTKFTIPEGYELRQISERLSSQGIVDKDIFDKLVSDKSLFEDDFVFLKDIPDGQSLEGFLYPATYEIFENESEEDIIRRMLSAFEKIYNSDIKNKIDDSSLSFNEIITLASIIEREGKLDEERPIMAAVFYNRIEQGMRLGSCATVQYILGERKPVLTNSDTKIDSPYNTYINDGLPPAPIASPGRVSLDAAVNPADVDYLYFVLTGEDGSHTFTTNYEDHLKAKSKNE